MTPVEPLNLDAIRTRWAKLLRDDDERCRRDDAAMAVVPALLAEVVALRAQVADAEERGYQQAVDAVRGVTGEQWREIIKRPVDIMASLADDLESLRGRDGE